MPVNYRNFSVDLTGGIDTKTERKSVIMGKLLRAVNVTMGRLGSIAKRVGAYLYDSFLTNRTYYTSTNTWLISERQEGREVGGGVFIGQAQKALMWISDRCVRLLAPNKENSITLRNSAIGNRNSIGAMVSEGLIESGFVSISDLGTSISFNQMESIVAHGYVFSIETAISGGVGYVTIKIFEESTMTLVSVEELTNGITVSVCRPKIVYDDSYVYFVYHSTGNRLGVTAYDINKISNIIPFSGTTSYIANVYSTAHGFVANNPHAFLAGKTHTRTYGTNKGVTDAFIMYQTTATETVVRHMGTGTTRVIIPAPVTTCMGNFCCLDTTSGYVGIFTAIMIVGVGTKTLDVSYIYWDGAAFNAGVASVTFANHVAGECTFVSRITIGVCATAYAGIEEIATVLYEWEQVDPVTAKNHQHVAIVNYRIPLPAITNYVNKFWKRNSSLYSDLYIPTHLFKYKHGPDGLNRSGDIRYHVFLSYTSTATEYANPWTGGNDYVATQPRLILCEIHSDYDTNANKLIGSFLDSEAWIGITANYLENYSCSQVSVDNDSIYISCKRITESGFIVAFVPDDGETAAKFFIPSLIKLKYGNNVSIVPLENGCLISTGLMLWFWDGVALYEHGFFHGPELADFDITTPGGGALAAGTYGVCVVYAYFTASGQIVFSKPSAVIDVTAALNDQITININAISLTNRPYFAVTSGGGNQTPTYAIVYVTDVNGSVLYEKTWIAITGGVNYQTVSITSVANLTNNRIIYTNGGVVENNTPSIIDGLLLADNRIYASASNGRLFYSKDIVQGEGISFSDSFRIGIPAKISDRLAVSVLDNVKIIFTDNGVYYFTGTGPSVTGANNTYSEVIQLPTQDLWLKGTPLLSTQYGVFYISYRGLQLINRSLSVDYVGQDIAGYDLSKCIGMIYHPINGQVLLGLSDGTILVLDMITMQWVTHTGEPLSGLATSNGKLVKMLTNGDLLIENNTYKDGEKYYPMQLSTSWLAPYGAQGFFMVRDITFLCERFSGVKLRIRLYKDYDDSEVEQEFIIDESNGIQRDKLFVFKIRPTYGKVTSLRLDIDELETKANQKGFSINNITMEVGNLGGIGDLSG